MTMGIAIDTKRKDMPIGIATTPNITLISIGPACGAYSVGMFMNTTMMRWSTHIPIDRIFIIGIIELDGA